MRVCFVPGKLAMGGIGRVVVNMSRVMCRRGIEVDVFVTERGGVYEKELDEGVRVIEGWGSAKTSVGPLAYYLHKEKPEIVYSARPHINVLTVLAWLMVGTEASSIVLSQHVDLSSRSNEEGGWRSPVLDAVVPVLYRQAEYLVGVSKGVADDLANRAGVSRDRVHVIYNPVVTEDLLEGGNRESEHPWFDGDVRVVLGVGRLSEQKDFVTLIDAVAIARDKCDVMLVIIGEGEERRMLEEYVDRVGMGEVVSLPGYSERPGAYMAAADAVVLSSKYEGFGNVLVESMAIGTPVVATDCPSGPAEILENGRFGPLVEVGDEEALAQGIMEVLERPISSEVLRRGAREFSADRAVDELLEMCGYDAGNGGG